VSKGTDASEEIATSMFRMEEAEHEISGFLNNTGKHLSIFISSHPGETQC
jgi:hypothetical protein